MTNLKKYAELVVRLGVNIQKDQTLHINAPLEAAEFVRAVTTRAYKAGAKHVYVNYIDEELARIKFEEAPDEAFLEFPSWKVQGFEQMVEEGAAFLSIHAENPELLKGIDPTRIAAAQKTKGQAMKKFSEAIQTDTVSWCVVSVPTKAWAKHVFPNVSEEEQVDCLWEAIYQTLRVEQDDIVKAWQNHADTLDQKASYLNKKKYKTIHYRAPGTDLKVDLHERHQWLSAGSTDKRGVTFIANLPSEEVFTTPLKTGANGYVTSTKPLNYGGTLIENFTLTFENGKIVDAKAEKGLETLQRLIETDEGSHFLGEIALVPHDSPISNANLIFFNTLFDENASNHLAIGSAYATCLEDGQNMNREELDAHGANDSLIHVDFMIGSREMDIDGITHDGKIEPIFRKGNWAF
ncbi:aminopeptidase [Massilibacterium senegalense]|uniref:aminopeptidase n=1 Tax=Massilibacterium senegalense TaxID=1632858 RepID=UPI0007826434|nr:aminopeptidase [Massilibacterium senegalense]